MKRNCIALDCSPKFLHRGTCSRTDRWCFPCIFWLGCLGAPAAAARGAGRRRAADAPRSAISRRRRPRHQVRCPHRGRRPPPVRRHASPRIHVDTARICRHTRRARFERSARSRDRFAGADEPVTSRYLCRVTCSENAQCIVRVMDYCGSAEC